MVAAAHTIMTRRTWCSACEREPHLREEKGSLQKLRGYTCNVESSNSPILQFKMSPCPRQSSLAIWIHLDAYVSNQVHYEIDVLGEDLVQLRHVAHIAIVRDEHHWWRLHLRIELIARNGACLRASLEDGVLDFLAQLCHSHSLNPFS